MGGLYGWLKVWWTLHSRSSPGRGARRATWPGEDVSKGRQKRRTGRAGPVGLSVPRPALHGSPFVPSPSSTAGEPATASPVSETLPEVATTPPPPRPTPPRVTVPVHAVSRTPAPDRWRGT